MSTLDVGGDYGGVGTPSGGGDRSAFTIGGVLRRFTAISRACGGPLLVLAFVLVGAPLAFVFIFVSTNRPTLSRVATGATLSGSGWLLGGTVLIVKTVAAVVLEGAIIHLAMIGRGGWGFAAALKTGVRYFLPNLAIYIIRAFVVTIGFVLLVVPGLMFLCRWLVAIQAEVAEDTGVRGALRRSRELTHGHRWRIFGLFLIAIVIAGLFALGQFLLARALGGSGAVRFIVAGLSAAISIVTSLVYNVGAAAVFLELRDAKEGGTTREIAAVFE